MFIGLILPEVIFENAESLRETVRVNDPDEMILTL